jgi:hypothetical protein
LSETAYYRFGSTVLPEYKDAKAFFLEKSMGCPLKLLELSGETIMEYIISLK